MIKAILFDLDNTLYDYDTAEKAAIKYAHTVYNKGSFVTFHRKYEQARKNLAKKYGKKSDSHDRFLFFTSFIADVSLAIKVHDAYWKSFLQHAKLFPGAKKLLTTLSAKYKLVLLTDQTTLSQYRKLHALKIASYFDFIITSQDAGADKPHTPIFTLALKKLNVTKTQCVMIGDNPKRDIMGAKKAGIKSILIEKPVSYEGVHQFLN